MRTDVSGYRVIYSSKPMAAVYLFLLMTVSVCAATLTYGPAKTIIDGGGGTFDWDGTRIIERFEIYLSGKNWTRLYPTGREEWTAATNGGTVRLSTKTPYAVTVSCTPLTNGIRVSTAITIPPGTEVENAVVDVFLAKKIFIGCTADTDGTAAVLDAGKDFSSMKVRQLSFATKPAWKIALTSGRPGVWQLRSSVGTKWRSDELRTFDVLYSIDGITTNGYTDECTFELITDAPVAGGNTAPPVIIGLPADLSALVTADVSAFFPADRAVSQFTNGDVVCFVGDSITHRGNYIRYLADFYATRMPDRRARFINRGIGGDSARNVIRRFDWDIATAKPVPTKTVVMLGMNDSGYDAVYSAASKPEELAAYRAKVFSNYAGDMTNVYDRLASLSGGRVIAFTPTPYEETAAHLTSKVLTGKDDTLAMFGDFIKGLAASRGFSVIDMHGAVNHINAVAQKSVGGSFTVIGSDRVHPDEAGNMMMAYLFVKAQRLPGLVSAVTIDAKTKAVSASERCTVTGLSAAGKSIVFTALAESLPFPVDPAAKTALRFIPFTDEFNRELFSIKNLAPGSYALSIDSENIGTFTAVELDRGVNLALFETPQMKQSRAVAALGLKRHGLEADMRGAALVEAAMRLSGVDKADAAAVKKYIESPAGKKRVGAFVAKYNAVSTNAAGYESDIAALWDEVYSLNKPKHHRYVIDAQ